MAWTGSTGGMVTSGAVLTAAQMNALFANFSALCNADSGSPKAVNSAMADASIGRAQLKTNFASVSGSITSGGSAGVLMNGYCFFPMLYVTGAAGGNLLRAYNTTTSVDGPCFNVANVGAGTKTYTIKHRYIDT